MANQNLPRRSYPIQLDLKRARFASQMVKDVNASYKKEYGQLAQSAPADIMTMGLGQTVAFWTARGKPHHKDLLKHVLGWLQNQKLIPEKTGDLLEWVSQLEDTMAYRRATQESLVFLVWVKRFAKVDLL